MGRKRSNIIKGDFGYEQLDFFDHMLDCVTLGTKPIYVEQAGQHPPFAEVIASRVWNRDPRIHDEQHALIKALHIAARPTIQPARPGEKWCCKCGEWRGINYFTAKADSFDKLHPYCNQCRAEAERRRYWVSKQFGSKAA